MMRPYSDVDLHALVDNQLSPDRQATITSHLATAPEDLARVEAWTRQNASIKALFAAPAREPVPLWLTVGQIAAARTGRAEGGRGPERSPRRLPSGRPSIGRTPSRRPPLAMAFVALAFASGLVMANAVERLSPWLGWSAATADGGRGFQQRAWEAHETFGLDPDRPVDVANVAPGRVQAWLDARVPFHTRVPDLHALGWSLLGGRLTPNDAGPGALLVYRDDAGDRLSLFSGRIGAQGPGGVPAGAEAHGLISWVDGSIGYAAMTSKGRTWLDDHAAALKQAVLDDGAGKDVLRSD